MNQPPRPRGEGVITRRMWAGIFFVGVVMAAGTLLVLDASLPGGLIEGSGTLRYAQTMAFTTLMLFQLFNVFNARSDERSAFDGLFRNAWLWAAVGLSLLLHAAVIYVPFLQEAFSTTSLSAGDWLLCAAAASSVLWLRELSKLITRATSGGRSSSPSDRRLDRRSGRCGARAGIDHEGLTCREGGQRRTEPEHHSRHFVGSGVSAQQRADEHCFEQS